MSLTPVMKHFMEAERFAVIGRVLTDRERWDNKVLRWYINHNLPVTPVKPSAVNETAESLVVVSSPTSLPSLSSTSISIIIHPSQGLPILKSLYPIPPSPNEPRGVWFQPGAADSSIEAYIKERKLEDKVIWGGPCVLVLGESVLEAINRPVKGKM